MLEVANMSLDETDLEAGIFTGDGSGPSGNEDKNCGDEDVMEVCFSLLV